MFRGFSIAAFGIALLLSTNSGATTYNLTADWSTTNNPNGVWSLRGDTTVLPTFFSPPHPLDADSGMWAPGNANPNFLPGFFKETGIPAFDWLLGDVITHTPDQANGTTFINSNVLFTAQTAGSANISGLVWLARDIERSQAWELYVKGILVDSDPLPADGSNGRASPDTFSVLNVLLAVGDTVELRMFRTSPGTSTGDFVGLDLTIELNASAVPLPAAFPLFATGLGVLGLLGWRRNRKVAATRP